MGVIEFPDMVSTTKPQSRHPKSQNLMLEHKSLIFSNSSQETTFLALFHNYILIDSIAYQKFSFGSVKITLKFPLKLWTKSSNG